MNRLAFVLLAFTGCFSSMIDDPCKDGYVYSDHSCVARTALPDAGVDGGGGGGGDGGTTGDAGPSVVEDPPDASPPLTCSLPEVSCDGVCRNLQIDPDNCGMCGHVCASGLCTAGHCVGEPYGHVVAIGHDYAHYHASMARVLGNAVSLGLSYDVAVAWFPAGPHTPVVNALGWAMAPTGRSWHTQALSVAPSALTDVDVLVIDGVTTAADGATWAADLEAFLRRGGVVIVIEGVGGSTHSFAAGAGLFTTTGSPVDATNQQMVLSAPTDSVAQQVIAPYLGEGTTVSFPGAGSSVITTTAGETVVLHLVR
ncbi:MAG: hypothetical protein ABI175_12435 [Polyangiales bacterium]